MVENQSLFAGWSVENIRLSFFPPPNPTDRLDLWRERERFDDLWLSALGSSPSSVESRPKARILRIAGEYGGEAIFLSVQPDRFDWMIVPQPPGPDIIVPLLNDVGRSREQLTDLRDASVKSFSQMHRLAVGVRLVRFADAIDDAYGDLAKFLPALDLGSLSTPDFMYRVNRRRYIEAVRLLVNRLATWSIQHVETLNVMVDSGGPKISDPEGRVVAKLDLDLSNDPSGGVMGKNRIQDLYSEIMSMAEELALRGDVS